MPKRNAYPQYQIAARLKDALEESGVSQAQLARACKVTDQAVHDWITTGRIGKQHFGTICKITQKDFAFFFVGLRRAAALAPFALVYPTVETAANIVQSLNCVLCKMPPAHAESMAQA